MYDQEWIRELVESVDLADLMSHYGIKTKRGSGKNDYFVSFCCNKSDFDNGRINKQKKVYQCKVCGQGGDAITFLQKKEGMSFHQAVVSLAHFLDVPIPKQKEKKDKRRYQAYELAMEFFRQHSHAHEYLKKRGVSVDVLEKAHVGYAPGGRMLRTYLTRKGFSKEELIEYELVNSTGMDSLFYRAVIPIFRAGKIVALYGRSVDENKTKVKHFYVNGSKFLYGIDDIDPNSTVILYESIIDLLVAKSHGIVNGVSAGGAMKINDYHANVLKRKGVKRVVICFDGDKAGYDGALSAGKLLQEHDISVYVVELPPDEDVASLLSKGGKDALLPFTKAARPFSEYEAFRTLDKIDVELIQKYLLEKQSNPFTK